MSRRRLVTCNKSVLLGQINVIKDLFRQKYISDGSSANYDLTRRTRVWNFGGFGIILAHLIILSLTRGRHQLRLLPEEPHNTHVCIPPFRSRTRVP